MKAGPTQMDYAAARSNDRWQGRPWLSRVLRLLIFLAPISLSIGLSLLVARTVPPSRLGINRWVWWAGVAALSTAVLLVADRLARRLLPLTALLKMTLIFPDEAPSRFGLAMRTGTTKQLERLVKENQAARRGADLDRAAMMLELVAALGVHDRLTRGHCERVRAYTDLVIKEMHLPEADANLLRWSALLHDVGKLRVPSEILTSDRRPTDDEWAKLATHPAEGMALTECLADWLGEWRRTIGEHHERWDGGGYPRGLSRDAIHLGARIVAVTDAFDVMTSARSYKKPIPAAAAREEIARCSATQFDPSVVRAFLSIGLRRLRFALGPLAWISNLPLVGQAPVLTAASNVVGGVATASVLAVATATAAAPPTRPAVVQTVGISAVDVDVTGNQSEPLIVALDGVAGELVTLRLVTPLQHGEALVSRQPRLGADGRWTAEVVITPQPGFAGVDELGFEVCDSAARCADGAIHVTLVATPDTSPPTSSTTVAAGPPTNTIAATTVPTTAAAATVPPTAPAAVAPPAGTTVPPTPTVPTATTTTVPPPAATTTIPATIPPATTTIPPATTTIPPTTTTVPPTTTTIPPTTTTTTIPPTTTTIANVAPIAVDDATAGVEDQTAVIPLGDLLLNDTDADNDVLTVNSVHDATNGTVQMTSTHAVFVPDGDFFGAATFLYTACDPGGLCADATVTLMISAVPDAPRPSDDDYIVAAGGLLSIGAPGVVGNDLEPDGEVLSVNGGLSLTPGGTMLMNADGSFTYIPNLLFTGQDTATYTVCDPTSLCTTATITITVSPSGGSTQSLYIDAASGLSGSPAATSNPEADADGDGKPGFTVRKDAAADAWTYTTTSPVSLSGPVTLDLFSAVRTFNTTEQVTLTAEVLECDIGGTNCASLVVRQWTFKPWSVGGSSTWTERQLTLGTVNTTVAAGREIRLQVAVRDHDLWVALSGSRPSALQLTV